MSVEEQVRDGRVQAVPRPAAARSGPRAGSRPVLAAVAVLLLWLLWLALPTGHEEAGTAVGATDRPGDGRDLLSVATRGAPGVPEAAAPGDQQAGGDQPRDAEAVGDQAGAGRAGAARDGDVLVEEPAAGAGDAAADAAAAPAPAEPSGPVEVPRRGEGTFVVAPGTGPTVGPGALVRYSVEVEAGVPLDPAGVAAVVDRVLADPRSWTADGAWSLQRTDVEPDVRIRVTSPDTTDALCAPLRTGGRLSCRNGPDVVLNALRWTEGAEAWGDDLDGYRQYLVNHEVGHFLGRGHVGCPGAGQPAPVMLQQTLGLDGCAPNAWPFP